MNSRRLIGALVATLLVGMATDSYGQSSTVGQLRGEVERARQRLASQESNIATASARLNDRIRRAQQSVIELRRDAAELQRSSDDQTLALEVIEGRLKRWQDQESYQQNVLLDFGRRVSGNATTDGTFDAAVATLGTAVVNIEKRLSPVFDDATVFLEDGGAVDGRALTAGPVTWFVYRDGGGLLGPLETENEDRLVWPLTDEALSRLQQLSTSGSAAVTFDPTLGRYLELKASRQSVLGHLAAGGVWVIPILSFALLSLAIAAVKIWQFVRLPTIGPNAHRDVRAALHGDTQQLAQPLAGLVTAIRSTADQPQLREDTLFDYLVGERYRLHHLIGAVAVTATVSPLLGLLGTVSGMINTFRAMTVFGSGDPSVVSGGISEALVTTELGLVVAVPALIVHALLKRKADNYAGQLESLAIEASNAATARTPQ
ncbi:MAG: MotA/TolQ/ExbB proton channel family protein [Pseudomonadota bacterium]